MLSDPAKRKDYNENAEFEVDDFDVEVRRTWSLCSNDAMLMFFSRYFAFMHFSLTGVSETVQTNDIEPKRPG